MLEVNALHASYGTYATLEGASFTAPQGSFVALLGPSGSGKTTLLRVLGGLAHPDSGSVRFDDLDWLAIPARARRAGFVFQHYALFRHMTVAANIGFGLTVRPRATRPKNHEIARRVNDLLALVQLDGLGARYPSELSGGQRQRVALARALAIEPRLLLLDEPFGALDAKVRQDLRQWLRGLHQKLGITSVFVTHDQDEAFALADYVAVLNRGRIEQCDTPANLRRAPQTAFVRNFLQAAPTLSLAG